MEPGEQADVLPHVIEDLKKRAEKGLETYGVPLRTFNGRNAIQDMYEELLDACMYAKQALLEQESFRQAVRSHGIQKVLMPPEELKKKLEEENK